MTTFTARRGRALMPMALIGLCLSIRVCAPLNIRMQFNRRHISAIQIYISLLYQPVVSEPDRERISGSLFSDGCV